MSSRASANTIPVIQWLVLWLVVTASLFRPYISFNEHDTMAFAMRAVDPAWISGDWYLSRTVEYRWAFDLLAGAWAGLMGIDGCIIMGRLLSFALFALAVLVLIRALRVPFVAGLILAYWCVKHPSLAAGEWMVGGLEAKALAWPLALLSIAALARQRWGWCAALLGAALSMHVLIGAYTGFGLITAAAVTYGNERGVLKRAVRCAWPFLLTGIPGMIAMIAHLFASGGSDEASAGWRIYVEFRVPHHCLPQWPVETWIQLAVLGMIALLLVLRSRRPAVRTLAMMALAYLSLALIGAVLHWSGHVALMRFYWFRMADTALLLLTILAALGQFSEYSIVKRWRATLGNFRWPATAGIVLILFWLERPLLQLFFTADEPLRAVWADGSRSDDEMADWIRMHTRSDATFLVPPDMEDFYLSCERPIVVAFKHSPQQATDILEWYARLTALNGGEPPTGNGFEALPLLVEHYEASSPAQLARIGRQYGARFFLSRRTGRSDLTLVHVTSGSALYAIPAQ